MDDDDPITSGQLETWLKPRAALSIVQGSIPNIGTAAAMIVERLKGGKIIAGATSSSWGDSGKPTSAVLISAASWSRLSRGNSDWWDTGDVRFFFPARDRGEKSRTGRFYGIRFNPTGIEEILRENPPPKRVVPTELTPAQAEIIKTALAAERPKAASGSMAYSPTEQDDPTWLTAAQALQRVAPAFNNNERAAKAAILRWAIGEYVDTVCDRLITKTSFADRRIEHGVFVPIGVWETAAQQIDEGDWAEGYFYAAIYNPPFGEDQTTVYGARFLENDILTKLGPLLAAQSAKQAATPTDDGSKAAVVTPAPNSDSHAPIAIFRPADGGEPQPLYGAPAPVADHLGLHAVSVLTAPLGELPAQTSNPRGAGRKPNPYWEEAIIRIAHTIHLGDFKPKTQAEVAEALRAWITGQGHPEPGDTQLKTRAKLVFELFKD